MARVMENKAIQIVSVTHPVDAGWSLLALMSDGTVMAGRFYSEPNGELVIQWRNVREDGPARRPERR